MLKKPAYTRPGRFFFEYKQSDLSLATDALWNGSLRSVVQAAQSLRDANEASTSAAPQAAPFVPPQGLEPIFPDTEEQVQEQQHNAMLNDLDELLDVMPETRLSEASISGSSVEEDPLESESGVDLQPSYSSS